VVAERPYVVVHVAVSLDGATGGFESDVGAFYELANAFDEDVTLVGADTILAQEEALARAPRPGPTDGAPLLAVVDSRGRVSAWEALRDCGHWSDVVALRAAEAPEGAVTAPRELATEGECVDLGAALAELGRYGAHTVRVDSGGALNGALLGRRLVDEVSLLVHPVIAGNGSAAWHGPHPPRPAALEPIASERLHAGGLVWLRYRITGDR